MGSLTRQQAELAANRAGDGRTPRGQFAARTRGHGVPASRALYPGPHGLRFRDGRSPPPSPRWRRTLGRESSHRSAAEMYGVGDLPADRHEFTVPTRRRIPPSQMSAFMSVPRTRAVDRTAWPAVPPSHRLRPPPGQRRPRSRPHHRRLDPQRAVPRQLRRAPHPTPRASDCAAATVLALLGQPSTSSAYPNTQLWLDEARRSLADHPPDDQETDGWSESRSPTLERDP